MCIFPLLLTELNATLQSSLIPKAEHICSTSEWLNSLLVLFIYLLLFLRLDCVSSTLSCVWLMVSEAAKFGVYASLPLVRPVRIDSEEDVGGQNAKGNEEPEAYTAALIDRQNKPFTDPSLFSIRTRPCERILTPPHKTKKGRIRFHIGDIHYTSKWTALHPVGVI